MKRTVTVVSNILDWIDYQDIDKVIEHLNAVKEEHGEYYDSLKLTGDYYEEGYYESTRYYRLSVIGFRDETPKEKKSRLAKDKKQKATFKKNELAMLKKLKAKYDN